MERYIVSNNTGAVIRFNEETKSADVLDCVRCIDCMYIIPEDGLFAANDTEIEVKDGDIIMKMYGIGNTPKREYFKLSDSNLQDYFKRKAEYDKTKIEECCNECENCPKSMR